MQKHQMTGDSICHNKAKDLAAKGYEVYFRQDSGYWVRTDNLTLEQRSYEGYVAGEKATHLPVGAVRYIYTPMVMATP